MVTDWSFCTNNPRICFLSRHLMVYLGGISVMETNINLYSLFRKHLLVEGSKQWMFWESDGTFPPIPYPMRVASVALLTCHTGHILLEINLKSYRFSIGEVLVLLPEHILYIKEISPDFKGSGILFSDTFWKEARREVEKMNPYYATVKELPCIPVSFRQSLHLSHYLDIFKEKYQAPQTTHNQIIVRKLLTVLLYEIYQLYIGVIDQLPPPGKKEQLFQEFLKLVAVHFKKERGIQFYAEQFQMTPRYFSAIIKECSQQSAAEWINNYVVTEIGILLRTTTLSVKEIADMLNFPDPSFLGKYFKRQTGMSPKQYRKV